MKGEFLEPHLTARHEIRTADHLALEKNSWNGRNSPHPNLRILSMRAEVFNGAPMRNRLAAVFGVACVIQPSFAGERQNATVLMDTNPDRLKYEQAWGYADAVLTGDTLYLSGVVAGVHDGETDLKLAYTRAFERIGAILTRAGASWDDVVDMTSFHTDLTTQMPAIVEVKNRYIKPPFPAWTAVQVSRLIPDNGITEIKITARLKKSAPAEAPASR